MGRRRKGIFSRGYTNIFELMSDDEQQLKKKKEILFGQVRLKFVHQVE